MYILLKKISDIFIGRKYYKTPWLLMSPKSKKLQGVRLPPHFLILIMLPAPYLHFPCSLLFFCCFSAPCSLQGSISLIIFILSIFSLFSLQIFLHSPCSWNTWNGCVTLFRLVTDWIAICKAYTFYTLDLPDLYDEWGLLFCDGNEKSSIYCEHVIT